MLLTATIAALILVAAALVQWLISVRFYRSFATVQPVRSLGAASAIARQVAVVICVRGCDPSLRESIRGVLHQSYQPYEVHVVVDSRTDDAWNLVEEVAAASQSPVRLHQHEMSLPLTTCSLKCHSILQAISSLTPEIEVVALLDADVTPHAGWLEALVQPLIDPTVGAVTGNQWFEPAGPASWGAHTRSVWNGGAMVLSAMFANPWAGSLAMRLDDIKSSGLLELWQVSIVDDGPVREAIQSLGLRIVFAPSLMMVNGESCTFGYVNRWALRMLTWSRLHEPTFYLSILHAVFSNSVMLASFAVLIAALWFGQWSASLIAASGLIASGVLSVAAYVVARNCVVYSCKLRSQTLPPITWARCWKVFWLVAIAQVIYGVACLRAIFVRRITWRGIDYRLNGKREIERLNYEPFQTDEKAPQQVSI